MNWSNTHVLVHLNLITGVSAHTVMRLLSDLTGETDSVEIAQHLATYDLSSLYEWTSEQWRATSLSARMQTLIADGLRNHTCLKREIDLCARHDVRLIAFGDDEYPDVLYHIVGPPPVLYVKGASLSSHDRMIAIVGSRRANAYGKRVTKDLAAELVAHDATVVSGGAYGVDICAHRQAHEEGGRTVVVLGSGLGFMYPQGHAKLFDDFAQNGGSIVSSFAFETMPHPGCFPARNRIISGLSEACIVVQAAHKSGALITAQYARDQGREVYVVPGSIYDSLSVGCHEHIMQGAQVVTNIAQSVRDMLGLEYVEEDHDHTDKQSTLDDHPILVALTGSTLSLDELHAQLGGSMSELHDALFTLQLHGKVRQDFSGCWSCC